MHTPNVATLPRLDPNPCLPVVAVAQGQRTPRPAQRIKRAGAAFASQWTLARSVMVGYGVPAHSIDALAGRFDLAMAALDGDNTREQALRARSSGAAGVQDPRRGPAAVA